jgi:hypothetical protein
MIKNNNKLSKWDEDWLNEVNEEKWSYVLEYIRTRWPSDVAQMIQPDWSINKQDSVRDLFLRLLQESQFDTRGIIRRTKEAWRSYYKSSLKRSSGNYTNVKLTSADKNKMRVLAEEGGLSSVSDVVSSILNNEHKALLASKKSEREAKTIETKKRVMQRKRLSVVDVFSNAKLNEMDKANRQLKRELEDANQNLVVLSEMVSEQIVILERYAGVGFDDLSDEESKRVQKMATDMIVSVKKNKLKRTLVK